MTTTPFSGFAAASRLVRPGAACRHALWLPSAGLLVGAASPQSAAFVVEALVPVVLLLVFATVAGVEAEPPSRRDVARALVILVCCAALCPAAVWVLLAALDAPPAIRWAVTVAFAGPVSMGAGVLFMRLGQPARPAVWASLFGIMVCPLTLPAISAAADCGVALSPLDLARQAALLGAAPAFAAFVWRRGCPRTAQRFQKDMRGLATIMLSLLAVAAGWRAAAMVADAGDHFLLGAIALALVLAAAIGWLVGAAVAARFADRALAPMTMICAGTRNNSIAWAAVASSAGVGHEFDGVFALFVAIPSIVPLLVMIALSAGAAVAARPAAASAPRRAVTRAGRR